MAAALLVLAIPDAMAEAEGAATGGDSVPVRYLAKGPLKAEIMEPNHPDRYNRGVRFTPVAAVLGVTVDGEEYLYHPDRHDPVMDAGGLAAEFDLCVPGGGEESEGHWPPGYKEAAPGEGFLKIGVGILEKQKKPYSLFQQCRLIASARTTVEWGDAEAAFHQKSGEAQGYAYELWATVRLGERQVVIDWKLANTGSKQLTTRQYVHNFFRLGDRNVGPDYILSFPYDFEARGLEKEQAQEGREIRFLAEIPRWVNAVVAYPPGYEGPNTCLLRHAVTGQMILCETSMAGLDTQIHARAGYLSPEQFIEIVLGPGEAKTWTRAYTFGK